MIKQIKLKDSHYGPILIIGNNKFLLTSANSIYRCNKFLRSLETGLEIKFKDFKQYNDLINNIAIKLNIPYLKED